MKIFVKVSPATESINFVDEKNRVLGWNAEQQCCESHYARVSRAEPTEEVDPAGSFVDEECDMTEEEILRYRNGEKIYRPVKCLEVKKVAFDFDDLYNTTIDLPGWEIDPDYFKRVGYTSVVFRLFKEDKQCNSCEQMFVVLQNFHNGYYSHGFNLKVGGEAKIRGSI